MHHCKRKINTKTDSEQRQSVIRYFFVRLFHDNTFFDITIKVINFSINLTVGTYAMFSKKIKSNSFCRNHYIYYINYTYLSIIIIKYIIFILYYILNFESI